MDSPYFPVIEAAAKKSPMTLTPGRGDEGDTIRDKAVLPSPATHAILTVL